MNTPFLTSLTILTTLSILTSPALASADEMTEGSDEPLRSVIWEVFPPDSPEPAGHQGVLSQEADGTQVIWEVFPPDSPPQEGQSLAEDGEENVIWEFFPPDAPPRP